MIDLSPALKDIEIPPSSAAIASQATKQEIQPKKIGQRTLTCFSGIRARQKFGLRKCIYLPRLWMCRNIVTTNQQEAVRKYGRYPIDLA